MQELAGLGIDRSALIAPLQAQNIVRPAGTIQTGNESLSLRVSGSFQSEQDVLDVNVVVGGRSLRLTGTRQVRRAHSATPPPRVRAHREAATPAAPTSGETG